MCARTPADPFCRWGDAAGGGAVAGHVHHPQYRRCRRWLIPRHPVLIGVPRAGSGIRASGPVGPVAGAVCVFPVRTGVPGAPGVRGSSDPGTRCPARSWSAPTSRRISGVRSVRQDTPGGGARVGRSRYGARCRFGHCDLALGHCSTVVIAARRGPKSRAGLGEALSKAAGHSGFLARVRCPAARADRCRRRSRRRVFPSAQGFVLHRAAGADRTGPVPPECRPVMNPTARAGVLRSAGRAAGASDLTDDQFLAGPAGARRCTVRLRCP